MCENGLLDVVARVALNNDFMIISGDDAQLPPIQDFYHGQRPPSFMDSDLLKGIAPVRIELNVCKRSNAALYDFGLLCRRASLAEALEEARRVFQCEGAPDVTLTVDNARRKEVNQETQRRLASEGACCVENEDGPLLLYEGAQLIGTKIQHGVTNAIWYDVTGVDGHTVHFSSERGEELALPLEKAKAVLTARHAMTVHKSQSRTLHGHVRICPGKSRGTCPRTSL